MLQESLLRYRLDFYDALHDELDRDDVQLRVLHAFGPEPDVDGTVDVPTWSERIPSARLRLGPATAEWLGAWRRLRGADLIVVEQASAQLINYPLVARSRLGGTRVAFWGHGRNFDFERRLRVSESVKRVMSRQVDWWFAYTDETAAIVRDIGYPPDRITVVRNAVDTTKLAAEVDQLSDADVAEYRSRWQVGPGPVGVFLGSWAAYKRPDVLVRAAEQIRARIPDFQLVVTGGGKLEGVEVRRWADSHEWAHMTGPVFGRDKAALLRIGTVMLLPAWVGLAVLDSFAAGLPLVTLRDVPHPPEFAYLRDGVNGVVVPEATSAAYADAVVELLGDEVRLAALRRGARASAAEYTVEDMAHRFAEGVRQALRT